MSEPFEDLLKDSSESFEDGNYFLVTIVELELEKEYPVEFRWKYKDGVTEDWSAVKTLSSQTKTTPVAPNLDSADVEGGAGFIKVTWGGLAGGVTATDFDRVNIYISGGSFGDGTKPAGFFKKAETRTFVAEPGLYIVVLKIQTVNGAESSASISRSVTVKPVEEQVQAPITPKGFSSERVLGGIQVNWDGTYTGNAEWYGFQAINIYAGTSATATGGTYIKVGQMTANKTTNKIVVPVDGTYVRYDTPVYIHASSVNRATPPVESSIVANVTSQALGARSAVATDLADQIITNAKLVDDAVTAAKIATSAITETKIANDAVTTPKLVANAITADKIVSSAITADKIATNAVTATKILAGTIDVTKLSAGTISVNNLESGTLSATSFIRAGTAGSSRIEISSAAVPASSILAGLYIYNGGTAVLQAPLGGGLTITGSLTATQISTSSERFSVDNSGFLTATDVNLTGQIKATTGYIGSSNGASGWTITANELQSTSGSLRLNGSTPSITVVSGTKTTTIKNDATISLVDTSSDWSSNPGLLISATNLFSQPIRTDLSAGIIKLYNGNTSTNFSTIEAASGAGGETQGALLLNSNVNAIHLFGVNQGSGSIYANRSIFVGFGSSFNPRLDLGNGTTRLFSDGTINAPSIGVTNNAPSTAQNTYPHYIVITSAGNFREYYVSSSIRYKENINSIDIDDMYTTVTSLNPVTYNFKQEFLSEDDQYGIKQWGLIAEEVKEVDLTGELVVHKDDKPETVRYEILPTYIIGAIKSMANKIKNLQDRLDALEG